MRCLPKCRGLSAFIVLACVTILFSLPGCERRPSAAPESQPDVLPAVEPTKPVTIGFSAPGADHAWVAAIIENARREAKGLANVKLILHDAQNSSSKQINDVEDLLAKGVDALVLLPHEGGPLTPVCAKVKQKGIPLINLDREINSDDYYMWIGGDNEGIGRAAGEYFAQRLEGKGVVVEIQGIAGISVTTLRSRGFHKVIEKHPGIQVVASQPADFLHEKAQTVMENLLQAHKHIDAVYTHDDEMAMGCIRAIKSAKREGEMFVTGAGGLKHAIKMIVDGNSPMAATFLYLPTMGGSAVRLAARVARGQGLAELWERDMPRRILIRAATVTKDNAAKYYDANAVY